MNYRLNTPAIIIVVLFILLAAGLFGYTLMKSKDAKIAEETPTVQPQPETNNLPDRARIITAKHDYTDGVHAIAGEIEVPTPCDRLTAETFFVEGNKRNVELQFKTTNESEGECVQAVTPARFKVEFEAPEDAAISATLDGEGIVLNLVEVPEGEDLDSFSEFIKG